MLDLEKLARPHQTVVPVRGNTFLLDKKRYSVRSDDGWHLVEISNNKAKLIEPRLPEFSHDLLGYTHQNTVVFQNFDVAKKNHRLGLSAPLYFNQSQTFESIKVVIWEDGLAYWIGPNYGDAKVFELKDCFDQESDIQTLKGITPELHTVFLFHTLERDNSRAMAEAAKAAEDHERMMRDIPYRLQVTFSRAGAEMLGYSLSGTRITVDWKIRGSHTEYNSVIDSRTWMTLEAGFCMSGADRTMNVTALAKTAEEYEQRRVTHITRRIYDNEDE